MLYLKAADGIDSVWDFQKLTVSLRTLLRLTIPKYYDSICVKYLTPEEALKS